MPEKIQAVASRLHLDTERLQFTLRTFFAAVIALYLAIALGLEHPNWSVMGVLSASQPTRERLFQKGLLRAVGSVVGAVAGVLILLASGSQTILMLGLLSIWIGLCVAGTVLLRGLFSYFSMVCSFTAAMVVLLVSDQPDSVWVLGMDRMLTAFVGVAVAGVIGALFTPRSGSLYGVQDLNQALKELFSHLSGSYDPQRAEQFLFDLMKVEVTLDTKSDGSPRRSRQIRAVRRTLSAMLALSLYHGRRTENVSAAMRERLTWMRHYLEEGTELEGIVPLLHEAAMSSEHDDTVLATYLRKLAQELEALSDPATQNASSRVYLYRDWSTARLAFVRVVIAFWLLGLVWMLTGWDASVYLIISATVMISVYSSADEPSGLVRQSFVGQVIGVLAGLICIGLFWPLSDSVWMAALPVAALLLPGAIAWAHPRLTIVGYDIVMSMMLLLNPWLYADMNLIQALPTGLAIFSGPLIVMYLFRLLLPVDTHTKAQSIRRMVRHELEAMSRRFGSMGLQQWEIWHARLYLRILRLAHLQHLSGKPLKDIAAEGMSWFDLSDSIATLHGIVRDPLAGPRLVRAARLSLRRMARLGVQTHDAGRALRRVVCRLPDETDGKTNMVRAANYLASRG